MKEISIVEAIIITSIDWWDEFAVDIEAYSSLIDYSDGVVPDDAKFPGVFSADTDASDLGKEWLTGPTLARFVGIQSKASAMHLSTIAVLGTPYCVDIHDLVQNDSIPKYEPVEMAVDDSYSQVLDIITTRNVGEHLVKYGDQYQKCIGLTVTLEDGVTPAPAFINFDQKTRTLTLMPTFNDVGLHHLQVNYDYLFNLEQN